MGRVSVWLGGLDGETWWQRDADERFYAASLVKVPAAVAAESVDLDRRVLVRAEFDSVVPGEWFTLREDDDQDPATWAELGATQTLRELRRRSLVHSGNLAGNLVTAAVGLPAVSAVLPAVRRMIGDTAARDAGIDNLVTARTLGRLLGRLPGGVEAVLRHQEHRTGIPAALTGVPVANKTGWVDDLDHDMAVLRPVDGPPAVLVVLTEGASVRDAAAEAWEHRR